MGFMVGDTVGFYCGRLNVVTKGFVVKIHAGAFTNGGVGKCYSDSLDVILNKKIPVCFGYAGEPNAWFAGGSRISTEKVSTTRTVLLEKDLSDEFNWK